MEKTSKIYVAGHRGLLGSAIVRLLKHRGHANLLLRTSEELDLRDQAQTSAFFRTNAPEFVFACAAKVGGIKANIDSPGPFLYDNLCIQNNLIESARRIGVRKLLFVGSSCIYPKAAPSPIPEEALLTGSLEPTNESYAVAKIAGIRLCQAYRRNYGCNFITVLPTNLFGTNDHYDLNNSHVLPALIAKIHRAKVSANPEVAIWGTGEARREFMSSDSCAEALLFLMSHYDGELPINIGTGVDHSIVELCEIVAGVIGTRISIHRDLTKPNGMMRKLLDIRRLRELGWSDSSNFKQDIQKTYRDFLTKPEAIFQ